MLWFVLYWDFEKLLKRRSCLSVFFFFAVVAGFSYVHGSAGETCLRPTGCCHLGKHLVSVG